MESRVVAAENQLSEARSRAEDPSIATDADVLQERLQALESAQQDVDRLYERWAELEAKQDG